MNFINKIGYACTPVTLPFKTSRSFILKNFSEERFTQCVRDNLLDLRNILNWNLEHGIYMFRISSDIIPFGSHSENRIKWWNLFKKELASCGELINRNGIRVSMHPGQYTILNSPNNEVVKRSINDLEYHCRFLDSLDADYSNKIVLHVGGVYGDKGSASQAFIKNFKDLSDSAKKRIVLENDDKSYNIQDVINICNSLGIPAVFDNLHHKINSSEMDFNKILKKVSETWKTFDGPMKLHYSDQDPEKRNGAHSQFVITKNFLNYISKLEDIPTDIMLEVKDKEVSALKCTYLLSENKNTALRYEIWSKYKYSVMERNYSFYKECSHLVNSEASLTEVYSHIDEYLLHSFNEGNFINAAEHVFGYVKNNVSEKEKKVFLGLLDKPSDNWLKIKGYLEKLCSKYNANYINNSYYFIY